MALGFSKYGSIRLGKEKPDYKTSSWVAMMFFTGLGAGTVYWAFLSGAITNAAPQLEGAVVTEAYAYEPSWPTPCSTVPAAGAAASSCCPPTTTM